MSWINDIRDLFARTEQEKLIDEQVLIAKASDTIAQKMGDFERSYGRISNADVKAATNSMLSKIGVHMSSATTATATKTTP